MKRGYNWRSECRGTARRVPDINEIEQEGRVVEPWKGGAAVVGRRIVVVGTSASGKTTMARRLSRALHIPHVELDALHWDPHLTEAPDEVFLERTLSAF